MNAPFEKNICCQPPSHLPQLLLFLWLPALPKKKTPNSAGICLEPSFLNDAPRLGESSVTHPRWGGGGVESWEGVQLGSWTPPKILQRQGDLRTCQELNTKWIGEKKCVKLANQDVALDFCREHIHHFVVRFFLHEMNIH